MGQSGVYVVTGADPETGKPMAYVGEAEALFYRTDKEDDTGDVGLRSPSRCFGLTSRASACLTGTRVRMTIGRMDLHHRRTRGL